MGEKTGISWTHHTFNPWIGCHRVSPGCLHCYAETLVLNKMGEHLWGPKGDRRVTSNANWIGPEKWNAAARAAGQRERVFSGSLCDVFEEHPVANSARGRFFSLIRSTPYLDWQLLTKRPENISSMLPQDWGDGYHNVWLGTSVETQKYADLRIPTLLAVPGAIHFISAEPLIEEITVKRWLYDNVHLDWGIVGGESGEGFRPMDLMWARRLRDEFAEASVPFFFKQSAAYRTEMGTLLDGVRYNQYPILRRPKGST